MTQRYFTNISHIYDRMNRILSCGLDTGWRRWAVRRIRTRPTRILDLATGTGDLAFELEAQFPAATLTAIDKTPSMLSVARQKDKRKRIEFRELDVRHLNRLPGDYDLVTCSFGFRNFADPENVLATLHGKMPPGGELVILEFFKPRHRLLGFLVGLWVRLLTGLLRREQSQAYRHLRTSIQNTSSEESFVELAERSGFKAVERRFLFPCCTFLRFRTGTARPATPAEASRTWS